jgi:hypothetical protein
MASELGDYFFMAQSVYIYIYIYIYIHPVSKKMSQICAPVSRSINARFAQYFPFIDKRVTKIHCKNFISMEAQTTEI